MLHKTLLKMKFYAIITAGGSGQRMKSSLPKQFHLLERAQFDKENNILNIDKYPILYWTIEKFLSTPLDIEIILVLPKEWIATWQEFFMKNNFDFHHTIVEGGISRFHSVKAALQKVPDNVVVAVHDGVRPLVSAKLITDLYSQNFNGEFAGVVPYINTFDSVREITNIQTEEIISSKYIKREKYIQIQTPQVFSSNVLKEAYSHPFSTDFTDDASVVESRGYKVKLVPGERLNLKITTEEDKKAAQTILNGLSFSELK